MPALTKSERLLITLNVLLGTAWILYRLFTNTGWVLDDEVAHFSFSRSVWENSDQVFNHWTRPGRNLIHCLAAPLGFTGTRVFTFALALVSVWLTVKVGCLLKLRYVWALPALLMFQSWFPELAYPVLTQTPFMLFWILGVWLGMTKRWHWAGFCFGYLSLIRHEGILITAAWGLWVSFSEQGFCRHCWNLLRRKCADPKAWLGKLGRDALFGVSTVSAIILYNLAALLVHGSFPFLVYFESEPTTMYGSGTLYHYVPLLINGVGFVSIPLAVIGCFRLKGKWASWSLLLATYPLYFVLHSLVYWKGAFASGGYYHFLMPMAPFMALLAAEGLAVIAGNGATSWRAKLSFAAVVLVILQGFNMFHQQMNYQDWEGIREGRTTQKYALIAPPMQRGELACKVIAATDWARAHYPVETPILSKHIAHNLHTDTLLTRERERAENLPLFKMPVGTLYIWDAQYCEFENRIKFESFSSSQDWRLVRAWELDRPKSDGSAHGRYAVVLFEKISKLDTADKEYAELGETEKYNQIYK